MSNNVAGEIVMGMGRNNVLAVLKAAWLGRALIERLRGRVCQMPAHIEVLETNVALLKGPLTGYLGAMDCPLHVWSDAHGMVDGELGLKKCRKWRVDGIFTNRIRTMASLQKSIFPSSASTSTSTKPSLGVSHKKGLTPMFKSPSWDCRWLHALAAFASLFVAKPSFARDAAGFLAAIEKTLASPEVYLRATTPLSPLITSGNKIVSFQAGTELATLHLCKSIRAARREILLQVYEWDDRDECGRMVREALSDRIAQAQQENSDVPLMIRVVVNDSWPRRHNMTHHRLQELFHETVRSDPDGARVLVELSRRKGFAFSVVHAKYAVIDGEMLILRTNNFRTMDGISRDFYNFSAQIQGPVASTVRDDWLSLRAESSLVEKASHKPQTWPELSIAHASQNTEGAASTSNQSLAPPNSTIAVLAKNSRANFLNQGPPNPQNAGLITLIEATEHEIVSLNPALNVAEIKRAIEDSIVLRGVDVTLILSLNMNRQVQHRMQGGDNADTLFEMIGHLLTRGGVDAADRLHVRWASDGQGRPAPVDTIGNNHAKTALYDGEVLWVGSMNWDWQSWSNSRELSVVMFDRAVAPRWHRQIWQPVWDKAAPLAAIDLPQCADAKARKIAVCAYLQTRDGP